MKSTFMLCVLCLMIVVSEIPLRPGHSATIAIDSLPDDLMMILREGIAKMNGEIVRVGILINTVTFEDGSKWYFDGKSTL